jgi:hypothetical protein
MNEWPHCFGPLMGVPDGNGTEHKWSKLFTSSARQLDGPGSQNPLWGPIASDLVSSHQTLSTKGLITSNSATPRTNPLTWGPLKDTCPNIAEAEVTFAWRGWMTKSSSSVVFEICLKKLGWRQSNLAFQAEQMPWANVRKREVEAYLAILSG